MIDTLVQDLRYAVRTLSRNPGLVAAAVICLALGIGANATIFGVVDTLLFRPPPHVQDPSRITRLYFRRNYPPFGTWASSITGYPMYTSLRDAAHAFTGLAAFSSAQRASLGRGADARRVDLMLASASFFPLLGVRPALGRFFTADEDRPGGPAIVVLSFALWRSAFGGDSAVIGRQLQLGRGSYTVIGIAPDRFTGVNLENVDVWAPIAAATPELMGLEYMNRGSGSAAVVRRPPRARRRTCFARTMCIRAGTRMRRSCSDRYNTRADPRCRRTRRCPSGWPRSRSSCCWSRARMSRTCCSRDRCSASATWRFDSRSAPGGGG